MKIIRSTFFPIVPKGAIRATQDMFWLTKITEDQAIKLDAEYKEEVNHLGKVWIKRRTNKKTGEVKQYLLKSPPTYKRKRKYLIENTDNKKAMLDYSLSIGYKLPEDAFCIVVQVNMPKSWTKKRKALFAFQRHKQRPDFDNIQKQIVDSLYYKKNRFDRAKGDDDARVSSCMLIKIWVPDSTHAGFYINEYSQKEWDAIFLNEHLQVNP